ncbi:MAG: hypothetical protein MZV65_48660 [Chromatiales bacterium]|nr:hypothetical protein [Chromatiales bacterium]
MGAGFTIGLFALGAVREILGSRHAVRRVAVRRQLPALGGDGAAAGRLLRARGLAAAVRLVEAAQAAARRWPAEGSAMGHEIRRPRSSSTRCWPTTSCWRCSSGCARSSASPASSTRRCRWASRPPS